MLLLAGGLARAQEPAPLPPLPSAPWAPTVPAAAPAPVKLKTLSYHKSATPPPEASEVRPVQALAFQPGGRPAAFAVTPVDQSGYELQLLPPGFERLMRIQSEESFREQLRQEGREKTPPEKAVFPEERPPTNEPYSPRSFASQVTMVEPHYVNYKRLFFEDLNSERYGWDLGIVQPFVSAGLFYADLALLPYHFASRPFDCVESSAGYCLPGDPVAYLLYPPNVSTTGLLGEAAVVVGLVAIFP